MKAKLRTEVWVVIGLFTLAGVVALLVAVFGPRAVAPYSVHNSSPNGLSIYARWLVDQGYHINTAEGTTSFQFPADTDVLFIVEPDADQVFTDSAATRLRDWVSQGHTLVLALDDQSGDNLALLDQLFGATPSNQSSVSTFAASQPLGPASVRTISSHSGVTFQLEAQRSVNYIADQDSSVFAAVGVGSGTALLLGTPDILANQHLLEADNARLAWDLAARAPAGGLITFDEFHHGFYAVNQDTTTAPDLPYLLFMTPGGWATLYLAALILLVLAVNGRRLGPALATSTMLGRPAVEYVLSLAGLLQLADSSAATLAHYQHQCQRALARRYGVDASLPPEAFARTLAAAGVADAPRLATLLQPRSGRLKPAELLRLVKELEELRQQERLPSSQTA